MTADIDLKIVADRGAWDGLLPEWESFMAEPDVRCGLFCDPFLVGGLVDFAGGARLVLATVRADGTTAAVLPFLLKSRATVLGVGLWRWGSIRANVARLYDFEFAAREGFCRWPVLLQAMAQVGRLTACDVLVAPNATMAGLADAVRQGGRRGLSGLMTRHVQETFLVELPGSYEAYLAGLSAKTRQTLGRKMRKMRRACGGRLEARCFRSEQDVAILHEHLHRVWAGSWHGGLGRQRPPDLGFLRGVAARGWLRAYVLLANGEPAASVLGYQYGDKFLDEAPAFDERWRGQSPGAVLNYLLLEDLFAANPPHLVDFGFGYNQYKATLGTTGEERGELWLPASARGRGLVAAVKVCDGLYRAGKKVLGRSSVVRRMKAAAQGRRS